jgi:molybdopterin/thiamine biosynthesis adenylyltransferase
MEWHNSKVLLIGLGGFGSPWLEAMAALGPHQISLCDGDVVSSDNLNRQFIHHGRVGQKKVTSAYDFLREAQYQGKIEKYDQFIDQETISSLPTDVDLVLDGTDNFQAKYLINSWAKKHSKKLLFASGTDQYAQTTVFDFSQKSACLECLYPRTEKMGQLEVCARVTNPVPLKEVAKKGLELLQERKSDVLAHYEANDGEWSFFLKQERRTCSCQNPFESLFEDYQWRGKENHYLLPYAHYSEAKQLSSLKKPVVISCANGINARNLCLKLRSLGHKNIYWQRSIESAL